MKNFAEMNGEYEKWFGHKPARSCVAVYQLPKGVLRYVTFLFYFFATSTRDVCFAFLGGLGRLLATAKQAIEGAVNLGWRNRCFYMDLE